MKNIVSVLVLLFVVFVAGCSIKEDRTMCPCSLILDFTDVDTMVIKSLSIRAICEGKVLIDDVINASDFDKPYMTEVPRCCPLVNVWAGDDERLGENGVVIPFGCDCPPIYMYSFVADAMGETYVERIDMHKNHCRLTIKVEGVEQVPYSFTVFGNVDGYGLDGEPSAGDFSCVTYPDAQGGSQLLLPRQVDSSLLLEVDDGTSEAKIFAIGQHITSSGYDWKADDLEDVTVILDYCVTYVQILIQRWDKEYVYNITL